MRSFPKTRMRRLRKSPRLREMVAEKDLSVDDLIFPVFVKEGIKRPEPIASMPGQFRHPVNGLVEEAQSLKELGIPAMVIFGVPGTKDDVASQAYDKNGVVQRAVRQVKMGVGDNLVVITDVCLCAYTGHGHCGVVKDGEIVNDATLRLLAQTAVSHAEAGADVVAPSGMVDGQVGAIRGALDRAGFTDTVIMSYAAKFASSFYGPFREATDSAPAFGDRRSYQMDPRNAEEALREVALDLEEGADIVMVKPALPYLDVLYRVKSQFGVPTAAYCVSGEYAMIKAASERGWLDERAVVLEALTSIKRAGADIILTYFAKDVARWLREGGQFKV